MNITDLGIWVANRSYGIPDDFPANAAPPPDNAIWWRRTTDGKDWRMFTQIYDPLATPKWRTNKQVLPDGKLLVTMVEIEGGKWLTQGIFRDFTAVGMPTRTRIVLVDDPDPANPTPHKQFERRVLNEATSSFDPFAFVTEIQRHQGLLALLLATGITENTIRTKILEEADPTKREIMRIRFESASWSKTSEFIVWGKTVFGLTDKQVDDLFALAITL